jgi:hypothetical protein
MFLPEWSTCLDVPALVAATSPFVALMIIRCLSPTLFHSQESRGPEPFAGRTRRARAAGILSLVSSMDDLGRVTFHSRVVLQWSRSEGLGGRTLDDRPAAPGQSSGVQSIASPGVPLCPAKKPLPLPFARLDIGEEIGLVDPDPSSAEVVRSKGADLQPAADLLDRDTGEVGGLRDVEEPANSGPAGGVLVLEPVRHRKSARDLKCSLAVCRRSDLASATS